jgi:hypothetical protein
LKASELDRAPAIGTRFSVTGIDIFCVVGGKVIIELWQAEDALDLRRQLGALPVG